MVFRLYSKVNPIETSYRNIKSFLPFISSTKFAFRKLIFMIALYFLPRWQKITLLPQSTLLEAKHVVPLHHIQGCEEGRLLLILLLH
ncbi:Third ORF in partial transposon ISC1160 [Saccharolobus solfataricus P2]|uniref:Third ORF in partial transposon ISC1160 n=2 Tax=Saccharolobus solfataricus TaxID=2287 RepID=Q97U75_SACS2|nr:Third ORF in partial transposon ISC1160 [Saccharolobus solfataricus P2]SAI86790.1 ORF3 in transposon ISC1160 [Saccharolobus solfataricus]